MHKLFFTSLLLLASLQLLYAQANEQWSQEAVSFSDGREKEYLLYYDAFKEWLNYKDELGEERRFHPEDVVSFEYLGSRYYSLPFNNGKLSFFKVENEGAH